MKRTKSKISAVTTLRKSANNPILVKFQNGDLLPGAQENLECHLAVDKHDKKSKKLIVSSDASAYIGNVERDPQMNTFIAIRNSVTNKMRFVQVETCSLLSEHVLKVGNDSAVRTAMDDNERSLYMQFGGKRAIKAFDKYNRMKVNVDIVKDDLDSTLQSHSEAVKDEQDTPDFGENAESPIVPPMNKDAKNVRELYSVVEILSPELLSELDSVAQEVTKTPPEELPIDNDFVLHRIRKVQQSSKLDSEESLLKIKALIYLDALMNLVKKIRRGQNFTHVSFSDICDNVEMDIRKRFIEPKTSKVVKTAYTTRKAVCHILILGILLSEKLEISVTEMVEQLKTTNRKELFEFAIYLGLKVSSKEFLGLRLPSEMDEKRRMKPEGRKRRK
ncbi:uncharacterized protein LOC132257913 [Phlebotomus argentipes]|uniref:uncharacterized protein LOC132257913 n=1 Tax=Phlebotomus argentipes TaxID=94469 RepID=UPI002892CCD9|nr:uncharacterized protein LOC132257913 [Phlebotomus argentipes]